MTGEYANEDHNEAVDVETTLGDALDALTGLSNRLFQRHGSEHPIFEQISSAVYAIEDIRWDSHYEALEQQAGEDNWWEER